MNSQSFSNQICWRTYEEARVRDQRNTNPCYCSQELHPWRYQKEIQLTSKIRRPRVPGSVLDLHVAWKLPERTTQQTHTWPFQVTMCQGRRYLGSERYGGQWDWEFTSEKMVCPIVLGIDFWSRIDQLAFEFIIQRASDDYWRQWSRDPTSGSPGCERSGSSWADGLKDQESEHIHVKETVTIPAAPQVTRCCWSVMYPEWRKEETTWYSILLLRKMIWWSASEWQTWIQWKQPWRKALWWRGWTEKAGWLMLRQGIHSRGTIRKITWNWKGILCWSELGAQVSVLWCEYSKRRRHFNLLAIYNLLKW